MIVIHTWNASGHAGQKLDAQQFAARLDELRAAQDIVWIDLDNPTSEEEELVLRRFLPVHSLTLEDMRRPRREPESLPHLPKVEEFPEYLFVVVNPLAGGYLEKLRATEGHPGPAEQSLHQLSAVLNQRVLITHHCQPLDCIRDARAFIERHDASARRGPDYLFHLILDGTVDEFVPVLDYFDDALEDMEVKIVQKPRPALYHRLQRLKRQIILLRKTLIYEREVLVRLSRGEFALIDEREAVYYRNVYDHLVRFTELIEGSREMVSDLMQAYLASISNRLNEVMKVLAMISTVVLPMTLIAGIYGMNFKHMPELDWPWGYPFALALMVLTAAAALWFFKWRRWL
jgi:magnesium transporter